MSDTRATIGVVGTGRIMAAIKAQLVERYRIVHLGDRSPAPVAAVICADGADLPSAAPTVPWLPVRVELGTAVIGPSVRPGQAGCLWCADSRARQAREDTELRAEARRRFPDRYPAPGSRLIQVSADTVAALAAAELAALAGTVTGPGLGRTGASPDGRPAQIRVGLDNLRVSAHRFLPDPGCPECGGLPVDTAGAAELTLVPRPKPAPDVYRIRDLADEEQKLRDTYVDHELGVVRRLTHIGGGLVPVAQAPMGPPGPDSAGESGFGRALDFRTARLTSITEAIERLGGMRPGGKRTAVRASRGSLGDVALDPRTLGLYPDDRYELPGFPYRRYSDDLVCNWVWGYSFRRRKPILVPESCVYYRLHTHGSTGFTERDHQHGPACRHDDAPDTAFVYEISNGCALGGCLEEAILYGILELVERDGFLLTWYARMAARRLAPRSAGDPTLGLMVDWLAHGTGYRVELFDITNEFGLPSVWAAAIDTADDPARPKVLCAAGSAMDPVKAARNAVFELAPLLDWHVGTFAGEAQRAARMVDDAGEVRAMSDHSLLYGHQRAFDRLGFLLDERPAVSFGDSFAGAFRTAHDDLTDDLSAVVDRFLARDLDVVVVDQSTPEHRAGGFACVKVIVPGLLPMTFGHQNRRVDGLPRLLNVPAELGYADRPLTMADVNPHPHPFP